MDLRQIDNSGKNHQSQKGHSGKTLVKKFSRKRPGFTYLRSSKITYLRKIIKYLRRNYISVQNNYISAQKLHICAQQMMSTLKEESVCGNKPLRFLKMYSFCGNKLLRFLS